MKIRYGFVTNSSSTSYTLILKNEKKPGYFNLLDMFMMYHNARELREIKPDGTLVFGREIEKRYFDSWTIDNYILNTEAYIKYDREDLEKQEKELEKLKGVMLSSDDIILLVSKCDTIEEAKADLEYDIQRKEKKINDLKNKIAKSRDNCRLLKEYRGKGSDYIVVFTDIDHWGGRAIEEKILEGGAVILKKETT